MTIFNDHLVIKILSGLVTSSQLDAKQLDEAIEALECIKSTINIEDEDAIDKVDEIQDYLQYLLVSKEPLLEDVKEELSHMINDLQERAK